jgi:tRNA nucleotidyltransferase (CCA-adding enzyme)
MVCMLTVDPAELMRRLDTLPAAALLRAALTGYDGDVYLVGGAVRDLARGEMPRELDLLVEGDPVSLAAVLSGAGPDTVRAHPRFATASVISDGFAFDVARARTESYDRPGALPSVAPADAATDLRRRDFTVNAIALALTGPRAGSLLTAPGALADLQAKTLRVLHAESFRDDPTRLLRLARYAGRLGFGIATETLERARIAIAGGALDTVSAERIGAELRLLVAETDPVGALTAVSALGLDAALAPGFGLTDADAARRSLALLPADGRPAVLVLAAATLGMAAADREAMLGRWAFPASERVTIAAVARRAPSLAAGLAEAGTPSQIAAAVQDADPEAVALAAGLSVGPAGSRGDPAAAARLWLNELRGVKLKITGDDLLAAGVPAGVAVGVGLRAALAARLDGRAEGREAELAEALRVASA